MSHHEDDEPDDLEDPELPDESDMDSFDEPGVMPCPHCRQLISEDAERCPHCGNYMSAEDAPRRPLPLWMLIGLGAAILAVIVWILVRSA